ncbi:phosphatidate cytidylyltransferase [Segetibacter sp. 3557_3]|uniref:phosphatidate cytidylyltransferase n=1 Tax=Segetibacter sp. 3557_3 TaxID=2547429 RepID=UPI001058B78F|nr:phosphatidate cytidylyltransferase [Segetibacter sp. 3557_3]TDH18356.1 phosphatidate cytidylyltransferase [Segetibacter sp. 3557_3]
MAFNFKTFKTRALTAVVFVAIMLTGLLWNHWTFFLLFTIIHFGCWFEYQKLVGLIDKEYRDITPFHKYGVMIAGWAIMLFMTNNAFQVANITLHEIGWFILLVCGVVLPLTEVLFTKNFNIRSIGYSAFGLIYLSLSWAMMIGLRTHGMLFTDSLLSLDLGWIIPVLLISAIWINDTMAYIVGSFIGKTPLSAISPKKTWEGTIGGAVLAIATVTLVSYSLISTADITSIIIISAIAAVIGTLGDLLESKLKRMAGVKDSGQIMPGHGGFLDRFDSLVLATPFVWLYITWLQKL